MDQKYQFIQHFELHRFDSSHEEQQFLLETQGRKFQVSKKVYELIQLLQMQPQASKTEIAATYSEQQGQLFSSVDIDFLLEAHLLPLRQNQLREKRKKSPIHTGVDLLQARTLQPITQVLKILFRPSVVLPLLALAVVVQFYFIAQVDTKVAINSLQAPLLILLNGLFIAGSLFFHELGHLSACRHYQLRHGAVGFGFYLYFPVFYADVTEVWKLDRRQRIVVNLAGIYFQLVLLIPFTLLNTFVWNGALSVGILFNYLAILYNLNPIFKFDGYWIVSDWLGVANLRDRTKEMLGYYLKKYLRKTPNLSKPYLMQIKSTQKTWVLLYSIASIGFFAYIFFYVIPLILWGFIANLPHQILRLKEIFHNWYWYNEALNFTFFGQFLFNLLIFGFCFYLVVRILFKLLRKYSPYG